MVERDTDLSGRIDRWEIYRHGRLTRVGIDHDDDEQADRWTNPQPDAPTPDVESPAAPTPDAAPETDSDRAGSPTATTSEGAQRGLSRYSTRPPF